MELNKVLSLVVGSVLAAVAANVLAQDDVSGPPGPDDVDVPVAEQDLEATVASTVPAVDDDEILLAEFARFKQLVRDSSFDEADSVAKRIIELAVRTKGARSEEMAKALTNLAIVQHKTDQFDAAQQNYQTAIEIIEENEDRLNDQLVNPLKGLAAAQLESGRPDLATTTYNRAVHVTHVNDGPHNLQQVSLLEDLAEVKLRMGDIESARNVQETIYALNVRAHRLDTLELVPALMRRADWQHRAGLIIDERATYRRIIRIIQQKQGKDSLSLIEPLVRLGRSFFFADLSGETSFKDASLNAGEIYFKQALKIAKASPDSDWNVISNATLALGDFYMYQGNLQRARSSYTEAWQLLSSPEDDEARLEKRRRELENTVVLRYRPIPQYIGEMNPTTEPKADDPTLKGTISVTYGISARGRASDLKLIEAIPPDFEDMQASVQREIRRRVFRPRYQDGEPAGTPGQVFVHTYWYRQSDLDAVRKASAKDEET